MNARSIKFLVCSVCLHLLLFLLLFWSIQRREPFEPGVARSTVTTTVYLVANRKPEQPPSKQVADQKPAQLPSQQITDAASADAREATRAAIEHPAPLSTVDYLPAGRLTRLPAPVGEIDLTVAQINNAEVTAQIELTVLIDATGMVAAVIIPGQPNRIAKVFAERVAERFKIARFIPGEIDGKAVPSRLQIVIVSEHPPALEAR